MLRRWAVATGVALFENASATGTGIDETGYLLRARGLRHGRSENPGTGHRETWRSDAIGEAPEMGHCRLGRLSPTILPLHRHQAVVASIHEEEGEVILCIEVGAAESLWTTGISFGARDHPRRHDGRPETLRATSVSQSVGTGLSVVTMSGELPTGLTEREIGSQSASAETNLRQGWRTGRRPIRCKVLRLHTSRRQLPPSTRPDLRSSKAMMLMPPFADPQYKRRHRQLAGISRRTRT